MKTPNKRELEQIAYNDLSDIDSKNFLNLYNYVFQNYILFELLMLLLHQISLKNLSEKVQKLTLIIDDKIRHEKLRDDINKEAAKILALSSRKIYKYEYLTGEKIPFNYRQIIEQAKFRYFPLEKAFEKQTKTSEEPGRKQIDAIINQNNRLAALTNKCDHKNNYKKILEELVTERIDEIKELTDEMR